MKIKKFGHCCLLIEDKGLRILTDPGTYSTEQDSEKDIDVILITHEHADHFHINSLKKVLENNNKAIIITNKSVGKLLDAEKIKYEIIEDKQSKTIGKILIEGFGNKHAEMYRTVAPVENTGYFISNKLFYPGDAFTNPQKPVEILALPVAGPWMKISEAINYALEIKPKICFPVHDGILKTPGVVYRLPPTILSKHEIEFIIIEEGKEKDFN